jgi:hypothetical protein
MAEKKIRLALGSESEVKSVDCVQKVMQYGKALESIPGLFDAAKDCQWSADEVPRVLPMAHWYIACQTTGIAHDVKKEPKFFEFMVRSIQESVTSGGSVEEELKGKGRLYKDVTTMTKQDRTCVPCWGGGLCWWRVVAISICLRSALGVASGALGVAFGALGVAFAVAFGALGALVMIPICLSVLALGAPDGAWCAVCRGCVLVFRVARVVLGGRYG